MHIAPLMEQQLPAQLLAFLRAAGKFGADRKFRVFLVGGMVRDLLLHRPAGDPDLLVQARQPAIAAGPVFGGVLGAELDGSIDAPSQFGTIKLEVDELVVDLATARAETYAFPGALPKVTPATVEADMARRDFTVNAIAVDLAPARFGAVLDLHGGVDDLSSGVLKALHDTSFADDPTRGFRAVRYEARLGLRMTPACEAALRRDIGHVAALSGDRVRHELQRTFAETAPEAALARAEDCGLLRAVLPSLSWSGALSHATAALRGAGPLVCLALLASSLSREAAQALAARINAPRDWARVIADAVSVRETLPALREDGLSPSRVYALLEDAAPEAALAWSALADAAVAARLRDFHDRLRHVRPLLTGDDLLALGVPQGPRVGELLRALLEERLDDRVDSREDEEALVRQRLSTAIE